MLGAQRPSGPRQVGVSVGGLLGFYGPKLLPSSLWSSVAAIKTVHRVSARFVYGVAFLCIYLGIAPANQAKPVRGRRAPIPLRPRPAASA